jgi:O-antigen/teichoic acid export membrane protein
LSPSLVKTIARNTISGYARAVVLLASGLLITPFLIRYMGTSSYGLWTLVLSVVGYTFLLDVGFSSALVRDVAQRHALNRKEELNEIVSTFLVVYVVIGVVALLFCLGLAFVFPLVFNLGPDQASLGSWLVFIVGAYVATSFPLSIFSSVLQGRQRYDITNGVDTAFLLLRMLLMIAVAVMGLGLVPLALVYSGATVAREIAKTVVVARLDPDLRISLKSFRPGRIREITTFSIYFFIGNLSFDVVHQSDSLVIGFFLGTTAVALYDIPLRLIRVVRNLTYQFNQVLLPAAADLEARTDADKLRQVVIQGTKITLGITVLLVTALVALGQPFIRLWVGPDFLSAYPVLLVLSYIIIAAALADTVDTYMLATRYQKIAAAVCVANMVVNAAISIVLVQRLGIIGAAIGTAIPITGATAFSVVFSCRALGLTFWDFVRSAVLAPFVSSLPAGAMYWAMRSWYSPDNWVAIIGEGIVGGLVYLIVFSMTGLSSDDRGRLFGLVSQKLRLRPHAVE